MALRLESKKWGETTDRNGNRARFVSLSVDSFRQTLRVVGAALCILAVGTVFSGGSVALADEQLRLDGVTVVGVATPEPTGKNSGSVVHTENQTGSVIENWQGAKNCGDSFTVQASKGIGSVSLTGSNCSVSPSSGKGGDSFTVGVSGAGVYSINVTYTDGAGKQHTKVCTGLAGKADQEPLTVKGWGAERNYYQTFTIQVMGGTTGGSITFETDGCAVSPTVGTSATLFTVTVSRVGEYHLRARMAGNSDYADVFSALQSGVANKSAQYPIEISGWEEKITFGDTFRITVSGGTTSEVLNLETVGCTLTKESNVEYEVSVDKVGAYSLTATRAGNYGYTDVAASAGGVCVRAKQPSMYLTGWSDDSNCNDSFPIHVVGGMEGGTVHFVAVGCSVSPLTGTTETTFVVTVNTVGDYKLTACMDETVNYSSVSAHTQTGTAGKATQNKLVVDGWDASATKGDSFDVRLLGGGGTGRTTVSTTGGCTAVLKNGEADVYTVTVTGESGEAYSMTATKAGDATYHEISAATAKGKAAKQHTEALSVDGWNDAAAQGETFLIAINGGGGDVSFETEGCTVAENQDGAYVVTVNAEVGGAYSLMVNRTSGNGTAHASTIRSGSVQDAMKEHIVPPPGQERVDVDPFAGYYGEEVWLLGGIILSIAALLMLILLIRRRREE